MTGTGGMPGTGGRAATGGMMGTGGTMMGTGGMMMGTGGMMMGTGGMAGGACTNPMFPVACPAHGGVAADCWAAGVDCNTIIQCAGVDHPIACKQGFTSDCRYPLNPCGPTGGVCNDPKFTKACPALGMAGPDCWTPQTDCSTVTICKNEVQGCATGQTYDCTMGMCVTTTVPPACPDPTMPQTCTPPAGVTQTCYPTTAVCSTISTCAGGTVWCMTPGYVADCGAQMCFPVAQCSPPDPTSKCGVCLFTKCCSATVNCAADPTCSACAADTTCPPANGGPLYATLSTCLQTYCKAECQ
jgi:hypothetical protein